MREITFGQATLEALSEQMARDPTIFVLGEGIGRRGGNFQTTAGLYEKYGPVRLCDTPICERGFVGLACGAAMTGTRPVRNSAAFERRAPWPLLSKKPRTQTPLA